MNMMDSQEQQLTEEQKQQARNVARRYLRAMGLNVPEDNEPVIPLEVIVEDDDGNEIERRIYV